MQAASSMLYALNTSPVLSRVLAIFCAKEAQVQSEIFECLIEIWSIEIVSNSQIEGD